MSSSAAPSGIAEMLLAGPRGRRLLLEYALASEIARNAVRDERSFGYAAVRAAQRLGRGQRSYRALIGSVTARTRFPVVTPGEVAERLNLLELPEPTQESLRNALAAAVYNARYWQEPDGEDALVATPEMSLALRRVAERIAASPLPAWWCTPVAIDMQQSVQWDDAPPRPVPGDVRDALLAVSEERHANGRDDPWSRPPRTVPSSARSLCDGSPAGLWFVEDSLGWDRAESVRLGVPDGIRVFEIEGTADWAELCARFPLEVATSHRHGGDRRSGRTGSLLVPDWARIAEQYDAVHLQVGAYLAASGVAIPIDDSAGTTSVIAGWNPDETYWFTPDIAYNDGHARWMLKEHGTDMVWVPDSAESP